MIGPEGEPGSAVGLEAIRPRLLMADLGKG
jgi:hypothetical protein